MKKSLFFLLGVLMITSASASEYQYIPLVREGVTWEYVLYNNSIGFNPEYELLYTLEFNGTSIIEEEDGTTEIYHNLYRTDYDSKEKVIEPFLVGYLKETDKVVKAKILDFDDFPQDLYGYFYNWTPEVVYDFNKPLFISIDDPNFIDFFNDYTICIFDENIGGSIRKGYHLYGSSNLLSGDSIKIIEGIGIDCIYGDLLVPYRDYVTGSMNSVMKSKVDDIAELLGDTMSALSAVYENGELVYKGCAYDKAQQLRNPDAINTVVASKQVSGVRYYNLAGVESSEPQPGMNIRVTTYTDGTRHTEKAVR